MVRAATVAALVWAAAGLRRAGAHGRRRLGLLAGRTRLQPRVLLLHLPARARPGVAGHLLLVLLVAVLSALATRVVAVAWAAVVALVAVLPLALAGHAAGSDSHMNSVDSLALHLVGACCGSAAWARWCSSPRRLGDQRDAVVRRYSTLAGACFALVALSGVVNAALRLGSFAGLATTYGLLVVGKVVALGLLGLAGLAHRRRTIPRLGDRPGCVRPAGCRRGARHGRHRRPGGRPVPLGAAGAGDLDRDRRAGADQLAARLPRTGTVHASAATSRRSTPTCSGWASRWRCSGCTPPAWPAGPSRRPLAAAAHAAVDAGVPRAGLRDQRRARRVRPARLQPAHDPAHGPDGRGALPARLRRAGDPGAARPAGPPTTAASGPARRSCASCTRRCCGSSATRWSRRSCSPAA